MKKSLGHKNSKNPNPLTVDIVALLFSGKYQSQRELRRLLSGRPLQTTQATNKQVARAVSQLKQQGWIENKKIHDKTYYHLTKEGRVRHLIYSSKTFDRIRDKQAMIVIFDIPEEKRTFRNFIRRLLKQMDFTMLQKSVFITPYVLPKVFFDLLRDMKLLEYFLFIQGRINFKK